MNLKKHIVGIFVILSLTLIAIIISLGTASPDGNSGKPWKQFETVNSAWLEPQPSAFSYDLFLEEKVHDIENNIYVWQHSQTLKTWCSPGKNLRFTILTGEKTVKEERYHRGQGNKVTIPPQLKLRQIGEDKWLAGRVGTAFLTSLHLFSWWGLPKTTVIEETTEDTILLYVPAVRSDRKWWKDTRVCPIYGSHPAIFGGYYEARAEIIKVEINRDTLLPLRVTEMDASGQTLAVIHFEEPWLYLNGKAVPGKVRCVLPGHKREVVYQFTVQGDAWLLKELCDTYEGAESLSRRAFLRNLRFGDIPERIFVLPRDVELPEHSQTTLAEGETIITVKTHDGLTLEGKLSIPPEATEPVPVVFFLPGAGPWTFDRPVEYPDLSDTESMFPEMKLYNYCDFYARELTRRGIAFFRINKRGCAVVREKPYERVNRAIFSKAIPSVLLADYHAALDELRKQPNIDQERIVLLGASEGTALAPRLALTSPEGIISLVMLGYMEDNTRDVVTWQNTIGPWRNIAKIFDDNSDDIVTKAEYNNTIGRIPPIARAGFSFNSLDRNKDGVVTPTDMEHKERLRRILKAVREKDEDFLWKNLLNLSSVYLLEDWEREPTHKTLLKLNIPMAIFHGENDGSCRVEGVLEARGAFEQAGRKNLFVKTYQKTDHDLNWARFLRDGHMSKSYKDIFDFIDSVAKPNE